MILLMDSKEIREKLINIVKPYVKETSLLASVTDDTSLLGDLKVNSARLVDMVLSIEEDFDIEIPDEELEKLKKIGDFVDFIQAKL